MIMTNDLLMIGQAVLFGEMRETSFFLPYSGLFVRNDTEKQSRQVIVCTQTR